MKVRNRKKGRRSAAAQARAIRNPSRFDPTRTTTLRRSFAAALARRFGRLKAALYKLVVEEDAFGLAPRSHDPFTTIGNTLVSNQRWAFMSTPQKLEAFKAWLKTQVDREVLGKDEGELWREFVTKGFERGAGRAFDDVSKRRFKPGEGEFYEGSKQQFLRSAFGKPVAIEKVQLLASRAFDELKGISESMSTSITRHLTDGLVRGLSPREIGRVMAKDVDGIGKARATTLARTEIIRAHAEGQLIAMEDLGVEEVGVAVEWSTTGDDRVCPACQPLEGVVLKLDEAKGMLPRHPNCRCSWIPANVGEKDEDRKTSKREIEAAVKESLKAAEDSEVDWGTGSTVSRSRPESVFNSLIEFSELVHALNRSFFADCPRDDKGRCMPAGSASAGFATPAQQEESVKLAKSKVQAAPVPSKDEVKKARKELAAAASGQARAGGESRGGSAADRQRQRKNLFKEFEAKDANGKGLGYVVCPWTGLKMHWTDDPKENPKGYPKFERGKIFTKVQGGGYQLTNLIPESFAANRSRNNIPLRKENLK